MDTVPIASSCSRVRQRSRWCLSCWSLRKESCRSSIDISMCLVYYIIIMYTRRTGGTRSVNTQEGHAVHRIHLVGAHPILLHFMNRMDFFHIVRSCLAGPHERLLDHAQSLSILIQNIILSPGPLYRIAEWAAPVEPAALGLSATDIKAINDDRITRSLDALVTMRARSLFFRIALHIIK